MHQRLLTICSLAIFFSVLSGLRADTFMVYHTDSAGPGSFLDAYQNSQLHAGADTILFSIPDSDNGFDPQWGTWTIHIEQPLEPLRDGYTVIDGTSQTALFGDQNPEGPEIVLLATAGSLSSPFLIIESGNNTISHLMIGGMRHFAIILSGTKSTQNRIQGCVIGLKPDNKNGFHNPASGGILLREGAHHNLIGGARSDQGNMIYDMALSGIRLVNSSHNTIQGNTLGNAWSDADRSAANRTCAGLVLDEKSQHNLIGGNDPAFGNTISANLSHGIWLRAAGTDSNVILSNVIGLSPDGTSMLPNEGAGICLSSPASGPSGPACNRIGAEGQQNANVISANREDGIILSGLIKATRIAGNHIGTDASGSKDLPNQRAALLLISDEKHDGGPTENQIGPDNVIIGSSDSGTDPFNAAIHLLSPHATGNRIFNNQILASVIGANLKRCEHGIMIAEGAHSNTIGPENVIAGFDINGITLAGQETRANTVTRNILCRNGSSPLSLQDGANDTLEPPIITFIDIKGVHGVTLPFGRIEFFAGDENKITSFIGSIQADSTGMFSSLAAIDTVSVVATVTDTLGNTSEFSESKTIPIQIVNFIASPEARDIIRLTWETRVETDNFGFYVQRSTDMNYWQDLGFVPSAEGSGVQSYQYLDTSPPEKEIWYRLRQVDFDRNENLSTMAHVSEEMRILHELEAPYPNPFNSATQIRFSIDMQDRIMIKVLNLKGETVQILVDDQMDPGDHTVSWDGLDEQQHPVASGLYLIHLQGTNQSLNQKVVYTK